MQSIPHATACLTASAPWVCAATLQAAPVRLVDDRAQLLVRIVLCASFSGQRHHAAGDAHLDQLRAVLDLVAHRLADLVDAVGDALLDRQLERARHERGEHRRVEVPAGRRDGVTGRHNPRPVDPARVDGLAERDVEQVTAGLDEQSEIAHGGEPRTQRAPGVADGPQHPGRGIVLHLGQAGVSPRPPISRLTSMSIRPGSRMASPRSMTSDRRCRLAVPRRRRRSGRPRCGRFPAGRSRRRRRRADPRL